MALRNILTGENNERLRRKSREVDNIDERIIRLLDDMKETLARAEGIGLAAPQIGVLRRVAIIMADDELYELINPKIIKKTGKQFESEGCLSLPNLFGKVERPEKIVVEARGRNGKKFRFEADNLLCRAVCHEIDHLDGVLLSDIMVEEDTEN